MGRERGAGEAEEGGPVRAWGEAHLVNARGKELYKAFTPFRLPSRFQDTYVLKS